MFTFVSEGTTNGNTGWVLTTDDAITLGTTSLVFSQFSGAGTFSAGDGLTLTGTSFAVGAGTGITVNADDVAIDTSVVVRKYATTITPAEPFSATTFELSHGLGTLDIEVAVYEVATGAKVETDITRLTTSAVTIGFAVAPADGETYRVVVQA
jgi:hypothetical protein